MISIIRFAIIFSIFAFGNCKNEANNQKRRNYLQVPIRVRREPPDTVEFQFNKTLQIEPISLKANEVSFQISEENDDVKKFRNTAPLQQEHSQTIKISLEYREPQRTEIKVQSFYHKFREPLDEIITISIGNTRPREESPMDNANEVDVPVHTPTVSTSKPQPMNNKLSDDDFEKSCDDDNGYSDKLLETALRLSKLGTHLLLTGLEDLTANPVDTVRELIAEKLDLPHLEYNILQAKYIDEGLLFEMDTPKAVVEILNKKNSIDLGALDIQTTTRSIFDNALDIRSEN